MIMVCDTNLSATIMSFVAHSVKLKNSGRAIALGSRDFRDFFPADRLELEPRAVRVAALRHV
jgi:hypothetical protein